VATTVSDLNLRPGDVGGSMAVGLAIVLYIPVASIPVVLFCVVGAVVSAKALRRHPNPAARSGLWLSVVAPIMLVICYSACFVIMQRFGH
jgi:hypothetical protein